MQEKPRRSVIKTITAWRDEFQAIWVGEKKFIIRADEGDVKLGSSLEIVEYDPVSDTVGHRVIRATAGTVERNHGIWGEYIAVTLMGQSNYADSGNPVLRDLVMQERKW
jgi:hypothetical protein